MESQCESKESIDSNVSHYASCCFKQQNLIIQNLQNLIHHEICLELNKANQDINQRLKYTYQEIQIQLKLDLRRVQKNKWEGRFEGEHLSQLETKIKTHINKIIKLKEINIYFNTLYKESNSTLEADVKKFMFYQPKSENLEEKLQIFFSQPTISELFLKEYEKSFNPNNFTADLIEFFHFLHCHRLLQIPICEQYFPVRNNDLVLIENTNIIFRQICDISDKYAHVQQLLSDSYVHLKFIKAPKNEIFLTKQSLKNEQIEIQSKVANLTKIANKIKYLNDSQISSYNQFAETIVLPEEPDIFNSINQEFQFIIKDRNQQFLAFLQELYNSREVSHMEEIGKMPHLDFLRTKIIKAETRWHLNRILSAFNIGSHIINQVHNNITPKPQVYSFSTPYRLSQYEFNSKRMNFYNSQPANYDDLYILTKNMIVLSKEQGYVLKIDKNKVIYPSSVHNYFYMLKYILSLSSILKEKKIYNDELLLQFIEIKADEMVQWAQIALNLYQIIKNKYYRCYSILKQYVQLIFQVKYQQELEFLTKQIADGQAGISQLLKHFVSKEKKAGWVSQIIFQFDINHDIRQALTKILQIQKTHKQTFYCFDNPQFYQKILNQVIQTRNNLKFDRFYSFSALHQLFGFMSARPSSMEELASQLTPLSKTHLRLPDLLRFYGAQTRLKREVFKGELYWISIAQPSIKNKFIIGNLKKRISFKDFLQENAKNLLSMTDKPLSFFLTNLQEFQRYILLFSQEVDRLKYIQCSIDLLKPDFPFEDHISAFSHKQLVTFFSFVSDFNLVEDTYVRREKKTWILNSIKKLMNSGKLKYNDLCPQPPIAALKQQLSNFLFFIFSFQHHYTYQDCVKLITKVIRNGQPSQYHLKLQILRSKRDILKQYQESQFMDAQSLSELTQIYELLILISIYRVLNNGSISRSDAELFKNIRKEIPAYESFRAIEELVQIERVKKYSKTTSKTHTIASIKFIMRLYKQKKQAFKGYCKSWNAIGLICQMTDISIISKRLFCNQLIELKRNVSGDEWKTFNKTNCLSKLRVESDKIFIDQVNNFLCEYFDKECLLDNSNHLIDNFNYLQQACRKQIVTQYDDRYMIEDVRKTPIVLFDEFRGYEVEWKEQKNQDVPQNIKKHRTNFKRGILNTVKRQDQSSTQVINDLQNQVSLEIVKQSLPIRKFIYRLQLEQKKIRDQISWETCKLQHNVINKINRFIEQSNLDQKQSLINFKYTVNLETIKGMENVIHERTQIFSKTSKEKLADSHEGGFLTEPTHKNIISHETEESLLDINVKNVFAHVKKLRIFWAWKNIYLSKQVGEDQWAKFSDNAQKILHNSGNIQKMQHLQKLRGNCTNQQILCNLMKQQNALLNSSIRNMKMSNLTQKLKEFKEKYKLQEQQLP